MTMPRATPHAGACSTLNITMMKIDIPTAAAADNIMIILGEKSMLSKDEILMRKKTKPIDNPTMYPPMIRLSCAVYR